MSHTNTNTQVQAQTLTTHAKALSRKHHVTTHCESSGVEKLRAGVSFLQNAQLCSAAKCSRDLTNQLLHTIAFLKQLHTMLHGGRREGDRGHSCTLTISCTRRCKERDMKTTGNKIGESDCDGVHNCTQRCKRKKGDAVE